MERFSEKAKTRWLTALEVQSLLDVEANNVEISSSPPFKPPSGAVFLFDRNVTESYKDDGYEWAKRSDGKRLREDHVKLSVGGVECVAVNITRCETTPSLYRRVFRVLNPNTGKTIDPYRKRKRGQQETSLSSSLVLVQYLDVDAAKDIVLNQLTSGN